VCVRVLVGQQCVFVEYIVVLLSARWEITGSLYLWCASGVDGKRSCCSSEETANASHVKESTRDQNDD